MHQQLNYSVTAVMYLLFLRDCFSSLPFSIRFGWDARFAYQSGQIIHEYSKKEKKKFEKQQHDDESVLFFIQIAEFSYQSP